MDGGGPQLPPDTAVDDETRCLGSLGALIETALIMSFRLSEGNPRGQRHALPLHAAVLDAVRAGNATRARDAMLVLLADARKDVASALRAAGRRAAAASDGHADARMVAFAKSRME